LIYFLHETTPNLFNSINSILLQFQILYPLYSWT